MKLLDKKTAQTNIKKDNEELVTTNIRLRKFYRDITSRLNTAKDNYEPEKIQKLKEFEKYCEEINIKKSRLLQELKGIENEIERKKDIYYGLIEKQDLLDEKIYQMNEQEKKLDLREGFIKTLEQKWTK